LNDIAYLFGITFLLVMALVFVLSVIKTNTDFKRIDHNIHKELMEKYTSDEGRQYIFVDDEEENDDEESGQQLLLAENDEEADEALFM